MNADPSHELAARDRELAEIAKSIASLAELFKDLSVLVIDQGTLLDSVEYNIEQTAVQMEDAAKELKIATGWVPFCHQDLGVNCRVSLVDTKRTRGNGNAFFFCCSSYLGSLLCSSSNPNDIIPPPHPHPHTPSDPGTLQYFGYGDTSIHGLDYLRLFNNNHGNNFF